MTGYTRQSAAVIVPGADILASNHNNEFNQIEAGFNASTGHNHAGGVGEGAKLIADSITDDPTELEKLAAKLNLGLAVTSIANLRALVVSTNIKYIEVLGYYAIADGGGGTFSWDAGSTALDNGGTVIKPNSIIHPAPGRWLRNLYGMRVDVRHFGAKGDGVTDDVAAFTAAYTYCQANNIRRLVGIGDFAFGSTWEINDIPPLETGEVGFTVDVDEIRALSTWPVLSGGVLTGQPLIGIGRNSSVNLLNLEINIRKITGFDRNNDAIGVGGGDPLAVLTSRRGCAISTFNIGNITSCNIAYRFHGNYVGNPSNRFNGNGVRGNNIGFLFDGGTPGGSFPIQEGQKIHYGFISSNRAVGILAGKDCRYSHFSGDYDFNGQFCSMIAVSTFGAPGEIQPFTNVTGLTSGATAEVLRGFTMRGQPYLLLFHPGTNAVNGASPFLVGETVTDGVNTVTIDSIKTAVNTPASSSFYFDIVQSVRGTAAAFCKNVVSAGYLGGIVGDFLYTNDIQGYNNHQQFSVLQGVAHAHDATQSLLYDFNAHEDFNSVSGIFQADSANFMPRKDVYLLGKRIYSSESIVAVPTGVATTVFDVSAVTGDPDGRTWLVSVIGKNATDYYALYQVTVNDRGDKYGIPIYTAAGFVVSFIAGELKVTQGAQPSMNVYVSTLNFGGPSS